LYITLALNSYGLFPATVVHADGRRSGRRSCRPAHRAGRAHPEPRVDALNVEHVAAPREQPPQLAILHLPEAHHALPVQLGSDAAFFLGLLGLQREHRQRAQRLGVQPRSLLAAHACVFDDADDLHHVAVRRALPLQRDHARAAFREGDAPLQEAPRVEVKRRDESDSRRERGHRGQQDVGVVTSQRHGQCRQRTSGPPSSITHAHMKPYRTKRRLSYIFEGRQGHREGVHGCRMESRGIWHPVQGHAIISAELLEHENGLPCVLTWAQEDMTVHSLAQVVYRSTSTTKAKALRFIGPISHRINRFDGICF
jgi:hypothetical protein